MVMTIRDLENGTQPQKRAAGRKILIVDDDRVSLKFLDHQVREMGYETIVANDGHEALTILSHSSGDISAILLDRMMPYVDGMTVMERIRNDSTLSDIPVIMQTSAKSPEEIREGVDAGVFHYLTKPINVDMLRVVLRSAVRNNDQSRTIRGRSNANGIGMAMMESAKFSCRTPDQARDLALFLSNAFPEPERVVEGLRELLLNGIEHGNLGIGFEMKASLHESGELRREVTHRLDDPKFRDREVEVTMTRKDGGIYVVVTDQGEGFNWREYMHIDPARAGDAHGRGIAVASSVCFDKLLYNEKGNKAVAFVADQSALQW